MAPTKTPGAPRGTIKGTSSQNVVKFTLRAVPLPSPILQYILENADILKRLQSDYSRTRARQQQEKLSVAEEGGTEEVEEEEDAAEN